MNEMNTLADLREIVAHKIDEAICGREIDIHENSIELPEMLGIVEIGETATYTDIDDSILSPTHTVWDDWHSDISSEYEAREKVQAAITSLKNKGILELPYLYEDKDIVEPQINYNMLRNQSTGKTIHVDCNSCGYSTTGTVSYSPHGNTYKMKLTVNCDSCEKRGKYVSQLTRWEK
jgi:hypothetical protein